MKQFISTFLLLMIIGCNCQEVMITLSLPDQQEINELIYTVPISGRNYWGFTDTLKVNETGMFELNLKISRPSFVTFWSKDGRNQLKLLVEQGNNYHVSMDSLKNTQITGPNEKGLMLYATFPNPSHIEMEIREWLRDTNATITSVHHQINDLKQSDMNKFKELLDNGEITKSFFDIVQKDRDCYYASMETRFLLIKSYTPIRNGTKIDDELLVNLKKIYDQFPPNDESLQISSFWSEYAEHFVEEYKQFIQEDFSSQKIRDLRNVGSLYTHFINESKKYLSGKALEFFQARFIYYTCIQARSSFEKEFISLFEQFEKDFPQSDYSKYLKPYIEKIIEYHTIIEQPFDQDILFLDNYEAFNTLEEAVKPLLGKKIYIDVWATWCSPCIGEFIHNEAMKKVLDENDIQQLYISIDRGEDIDLKWKEYIKYYQLKGKHLRANEVLYLNLMKQYSGNAENSYIAIPWYILIDEKGNIVNDRAKNPSEIVSGQKIWEID